MKRIIAILSILVVLGLLGACNKAPENPPTKNDGSVTPSATPTATPGTQASTGTPTGSSVGQSGGGLAGLLGMGTPAPAALPAGADGVGKPGEAWGSLSPSDPSSSGTVATGDYNDVIVMVDRITGVLERFVNGLRGAQLASEAARVVDRFVSDLEAMKGAITQITKVHPELLHLKEPPPALRPSIQRLMKVSSQVQNDASLVQKMQRFAQDPVFQQAIMRMAQAAQVLQSMGGAMK